MNRILRIKDEPVELRWPKVSNLVQAQVDKNTALYVTQRIEKEARRDDMLFWASQPPGEPRPDTTGKVSRPLGESIWALIHSLTP